MGHHDHNEDETRTSTRKLVELADAEQAWILHSHDDEQWATARHAPSFYD